MATLLEYFKKDQGRSLALDKDFDVRGETGDILLTLKARLHTDFEANALYISFYIPTAAKVDCPARLALNTIEEVISWRDQVFVQGGFSNQEQTANTECVFTGRTYIQKIR